MIRPRVPEPTGIVMGEPLSVADCPRFKPSVPDPVSLLTLSFVDVMKQTVHGNASDDIFTQMLLLK